MLEDNPSPGPSNVVSNLQFEDLLELVGTNGPRNYLIFYAACIGCMITAMHTFAYQFIGATPDYWCHVGELSTTNWTSNQIKDIAIPYTVTDGKLSYSKCQMYDLNYTELASMSFESAKAGIENDKVRKYNTIYCSSRDYESHAETIVTKWDLVCERRALYSTTQAAIQGGMLLGSLAFGYWIDRFGRFYLYKLCVIFFLIGGFATALSPNIEIFIILKVITAMLGNGFYLSGFVLSMEFCVAKQRSYISSYFVIPWGLGIMLTPGIAYLVPTWYWLEVALTAPGLILLINFWVMPESPRWLILNGRFEEAIQILNLLATSNKKELPSHQELLRDMQILKTLNGEEKTQVDGGLLKKALHTTNHILTLLTDVKFRLTTICVFFCWFSVAMVYYGISLGSVTLSTNDYLYIFLGGVIEIPSYVLLWPAVVVLGRKKTFILLFFACAISIFLVMILEINFEHESFPTLKLIFFLIGKLAITATFHLAWVYTAELYPTMFRSLIVGEASAIGRIGSICSPYINDILGNVTSWAPAALFCGFSMTAGMVAMVFPETTGRNLPEYNCPNSIKKSKGTDGIENSTFTEEIL